MLKLDPNATVEVMLDSSPSVTFVYKVLSCREWMKKSDARKDDEDGATTWGAVADSAAFGLQSVRGAEIEPTADGLLDSLTIGELVELARKSSDACALIGDDKKKSDSPV